MNEDRSEQYFEVFTMINELKRAICEACTDGITRASCRESLNTVAHLMQCQYERNIGMR